MIEGIRYKSFGCGEPNKDSREKTNQTSLCSELSVVYVVNGAVIFRLLCYQIDWLVLLHYVGLSRKMK